MKLFELTSQFNNNWNSEYFESLSSFKQRLEYCKNNLEYIISGSSRSVYGIDDKRVLKLAKNKKGIAQNEAEIELGNDYYAPSILAKILEYDENNQWLVMERAQKLNLKTFKQYTDVDFKDLYEYLKEKFSYGGHLTKVKIEELDNNEWIQELMELLGNFTFVKYQDFQRLSTYGLINNEIKAIDYGLTDEVFENFYK